MKSIRGEHFRMYIHEEEAPSEPEWDFAQEWSMTLNTERATATDWWGLYWWIHVFERPPFRQPNPVHVSLSKYAETFKS